MAQIALSNDKRTGRQSSHDEESLHKLAEEMHCKKSVSLMIKNSSDRTLCEPKVYTASGKIYKNLPNKINPGEEVTLGFHKTKIPFRGAEGVVVYDIRGTEDHLCIFYCVPYVGFNGFGLKWKTCREISADENLCNEMAKKQWEIKNALSWHDAKEDNIKLLASGFMNQADKAHMVVEISNRNTE
ncbi:uncharacterized protein LOC134684805 [Mytilus trossulus]|uniref:uncharacterized protein LOC134684805 n=1 Tax=Mytilus trossulus TaxID=6551 RepID=UPI0030059CB8